MISAFTDRALRFLSAEVRGLHAAAYVLAVCALLSSLLALVRDRLLAHSFGASATLDIYYAGFRIPDLIFVATGALVSVYMLIPELTKRTSEEQKDYIDTIIVGFSVLAILVSAAAALLAPFILSLLFPEYGGAHFSNLVLITRILLLQPIFLGFSNILAAITQVRQRYAIYALSPLLYNLGIIAGVVFLYPKWGIAGLAWGVVFGALMHAAIQFPSVLSDGYFARIPRLRDPRALMRTAFVSLPRALALSMSQLTFLGLTALAATLTSGSIAVFMFAYNLQAVPLAIIGASYSVAAFPTLAAALSRGHREEFISHVAIAARYVFFWSVPASALILILRAYIVRVILGSGAFDWTDTRLTAAAFALLSFSLVAQGLTLLLVRGYYAAGRTFVPLIVSAGVALGTLALGFVSLHVLNNDALLREVERSLRVQDIPGSSVLALAFSYALVSIIGTLVLTLHFERRFPGFLAQIWRAVVDSVLASCLAALGAYGALAVFGTFITTDTTVSIFSLGLLGGTVGIVIAALTYYALGSREFSETFTAIHSRLWRKTKEEGITLVTSAEQ
ncbi:MAG: lipid II flippase MurJ [Candidatus Paceibacterota bacterium]